MEVYNSSYSIISLNTGGLRTQDRLDTALQYCKNSEADFSILQETHLGPAKYNQLRNDWQGQIILAPGTVHRDGIMLLRKNSAPEIQLLRSDPKGKYLIFNIVNTNDTVVAIYAPSGILKEKRQERKLFYYRIRRLIRKYMPHGSNLILLGDFNTTLNKLDRTSGENFDTDVQKELQGILSEFDLEDHWRLQNPKERVYTHYHGRTDTYARLDRAYTTTKIRTDIHITHNINSFSDHYHSVILKRSNKDLERGKGYWILNNALLKDSVYCAEIKKPWCNWQEQKQGFESVSEWWEYGKKHIRDFTKIYTRASTAQKNKRKNSLLKRLRNTYSKIHTNPNLQITINNLRSQLYQIELEEAQGAKIRAKIQHELQGEKCSKLFFSEMEKRKDVQQTMLSLNSEKGKLLTSQTDILEEVKNYFRKLYNPQDPFLQPNFNRNNGKSSFKKDSEIENKKRNQNKMIQKLNKTISEENKQKCEKDIEATDIEQAIKSFQNNKSPGNDGLTVEFYKAFFDILQNDLKQLYEEISQKRKMPDSMRQAVITCIYKKGNMQNITNWRPISLLNYDYKIYTKVIATILQGSLEDIIDSEQTAAIRGRSIIENLQLNRDIISYANLNNLEAAIITLDQEKAFDKVDRQFLFKILQKFGYGPKLIAKIETIYKDIEAQVKINGYLSHFFSVIRGVRQGCPLSMILYILLAEVFIQNIKQNDNIKGITVEGREIKISAFADNTTLYIGDNNSLGHLQIQLLQFERYTGVNYNWDKCFGMWMGTNIGKQSKPLDFKWNSKKIKILGFIYGQNGRENPLENWDKVKKKIQKDIANWNNLRLSLIGRKLVINQIMLSKMWYLAYVETPPKFILQEIKREIYNFLWNFKKIRVNMLTTTMPIAVGGLAIIDIETQCKALLCSIVVKFIRDIPKNKVWTELMLWHLNRFRKAHQGINTFKTFLGNVYRSQQERFYRNLLTAWSDLTENELPEPATLQEIHNEPLFLNPKSENKQNPSKYLGKPPPPWARERFVIVRDICNKNRPGFISADKFLEANIPRKVRFNPKAEDLEELKKLLPHRWTQKIQRETAQPESSKIKIKYRAFNEKWKIAQIEVLHCKDFYRTIHFKKLIPLYQIKKYEKWDKSVTTTLSEKDWKQIFTNLYKRTKQKEAFDIRYKFLHFAQPTAVKLQELREGQTSTDCPRCGKHEETHTHWMFSCASSQNLFIYLQSLLETIYAEPFDNTEKDALLIPLLEYPNQFPIAEELIEIYFISIRTIRKDATYGTLISSEMQLKLFKDSIRERVMHLYNAAALDKDLNNFLSIWNKLITKEGKVQIP